MSSFLWLMQCCCCKDEAVPWTLWHLNESLSAFYMKRWSSLDMGRFTRLVDCSCKEEWQLRFGVVILVVPSSLFFISLRSTLEYNHAWSTLSWKSELSSPAIITEKHHILFHQDRPVLFRSPVCQMRIIGYLVVHHGQWNCEFLLQTVFKWRASTAFLPS